jgi:hypothetical protein
MRVKVDWRMASKATYRQFCEENPEIKLSYVEFQNIIYSFNEGFRDYLMETGMKGKLPWGFGDFAVTKRKPRIKKILEDGSEIISLPVDWKKTREAGKKIYHLNSHTEGFKFSIKWFLDSRRFKYSEIWTFKPSRTTSRLIRHYIQQGHQHRYYEWNTLMHF